MHKRIDWSEYKRCNPDISSFSDADAKNHYEKFGKKEGRLMGHLKFILDHHLLPLRFTAHGYKNMNSDLAAHSDDAALKHFVTFGRFEKREYLPQLIRFDITHIISDPLAHFLCGLPERKQRKASKIVNIYFQILFREPTIEEIKTNIKPIAQPVERSVIPTHKSESRNVAVVLHIGDRENIIDEFATLNRTLQESEWSSDLYITVFNDTLKEKVLDAFTACPNQRVFVHTVENKGLDIGPFLLMLKQIVDSPVKYNTLFKWHSKGDTELRLNAHSIFATHEKLSETIKLSTHGTVCRFKGTAEHIFYNAWWLRFVGARLKETPFSPEECQFAQLTIFAAPMSVFEHYAQELCDLYPFCNTPCSVDFAWFCRFAGVGVSPFNAKQIAEVCGVENMFPFVGHAYWHETKIVSRDGMLEHAMERIFGYIVMRSGFKIFQLDT